MEQYNQPLTLEDIDEIMNEINNSSSCNVHYMDGIISGNSDRNFSLEIKRRYEDIGEISYDEILRNPDEGDDEFYIKIKLRPEFIPVPAVPLYKVLNQERTQGDWQYDGVTKVVVDNTDEVIYDGIRAFKKCCTQNAKYTALAVNNLHHLAAVLEYVLENTTSKNIAYRAKEALSRIS